ncbi:MAG: TatD family hydrolase [Capsulimonadaceae bacterium]
MLVDTHSHLNHADFAEDAAAVRQRAVDAGVHRLLVIGYDLASSRRAAAMAAQSACDPVGPALWACIGIHPESADEWLSGRCEDSSSPVQGEVSGSPPFRPGVGSGGACASSLRALSAGPRIAAYGEIGLDYHWDTVPRDRQRTAFAEQIDFAARVAPTGPLPIVIHCRDAMADVLEVLRESKTPSTIVMHCFTGDIDAARACLEAGAYLGIGGVVTFKKSEALRAAVAYAPLDRLLLETDCPYLAPQNRRGRRNEPSYLAETAETVAAVRGQSMAEIADATCANAERVFRLTV